MYQPAAEARTATIVPASSALTMNGNRSSWCRSDTRFSESDGLPLIGAGPTPGSAKATGCRSLLGVAIAVDVRRLGLADHDQPPVASAENLDRRSIQLAELRRGDHLVDPAGQGVTRRQIDHPIEVV